MTYSVYLMRDATGTPLYAGVTTDLLRRLREHRSQPWFPDVATTTVEQVAETKAEGLRLEREAIAQYRPTHNVAGTPLMSGRHEAAHARRRARQADRHSAGLLCSELRCPTCAPMRVPLRTLKDRMAALAEAGLA